MFKYEMEFEDYLDSIKIVNIKNCVYQIKSVFHTNKRYNSDSNERWEKSPHM